jgi:hypothetical protein
MDEYPLIEPFGALFLFSKEIGIYLPIDKL